MLRDRPYLLLFPVGALLGAVGIVHWVLHAQRLLPDYRPVFHVTAQVQGFLTCFVAGFLLTMLPRRLDGSPPARWEVALLALCPAVATALAWNRAWIATQVVWLVAMIVLMGFVVVRMRGARRPPPAFAWIPSGLIVGALGALLTVAESRLPAIGASWHQFGQDLVLQGFPLALVLGAGGIVFPLMTRGTGPPDGSGRADRGVVALHLLGVIALLASFWVAVTASLRAGLVLRAIVVLAVLLGSAELWRPPARPGWNARLIWTCGWMVPAGLVLAAIWPLHQRAGLHVTFIGGYALLALTVAAQVSFGHGGRREEVLGRPPLLALLAVAAAVAMGARIAMETDPQRYFPWMEIAGVAWLTTLLLWGVWVVPVLGATRRNAS
jgi:uncharacterized protein involved in response to NO